MAMSTLQWNAPADSSLWGRLKQVADVVYQRSGAYLTGQYMYGFHNETAWTVKMHLVDDVSAGGHGAASGYFLTLPAGSHNVEIPMKSSLVTVTAGFYHPTRGCYEIFWERRRFAWSPRTSAAVQQRHSTDANSFRSDVTPGSPLVVQLHATQGEFAIFTPREGSLGTLDDGNAVAYSLVDGQWMAAAVMEVLPGGVLQLEDGTSSWTMHPAEQPTLVPAGPWPSLAGTEGEVSAGKTVGEVMGSCPARPPLQDLLVPVEEAVKAEPAQSNMQLPLQEQSGPPEEAVEAKPTQSDMSDVYEPGQSLKVYSQSKAVWVDAEVTKVLQDGSVTLQYTSCKSLKTLRPAEQAKMLKTM